MRNVKLKVLVVCLIGLLLGIAPDCLAHWDINVNFKYSMLPHTEPNMGIDVDATNYTLANDFECTLTGPLTDMHIWGSWYHDEYPAGGPGAVTFTLRIYSDDPPGPRGSDPSNSYSKPDELLWSRPFGPGSFHFEQHRNVPEGWYSPQTDEYEEVGASLCWLYNFILDPDDPNLFRQVCHNIYWFSVIAKPQTTDPEIKFGWKSSRSRRQRLVDATWTDPYKIDWREIIYPKGHPCHPNSLDLAFVINGKSEPKVEHMKWSQPPIEIDPNSEKPIFCGWDEPSFLEWIPPVWFDCWDCRTQCHGDADCDGHVGVLDANIVQAAYETSYPEPNYNPCADFDRNLSVNQLDVSILKLNWETNPPADCNQRRQSWHIVADDFRCLGRMPITSVHWWGSHYGWDGSEPPLRQPSSWLIGFWSNVPAAPNEWNPGDPHKMHFPQMPDHNGWDVDITAENISCDDWICTESGLLTDIHFWYSWETDWEMPIDSINVRIYDNLPADDPTNPYSYSVPGGLLWTRDFGPNDFSTRYWGEGDQGFIHSDHGPTPNDHNSIYQCNIIDIQRPFYQTKDNIYWLALSITVADARIGWKTSASNQFGDAAVYDEGTGSTWLPWSDPQTGEAMDLAFVITNGVHYSRPEKLLWQVEVRNDGVEVENVGRDQFPDPCIPSDTCFQYNVNLGPNEYFRQADFEPDTTYGIFWLSIAAVYPNDVNSVEFPWGWKTRPWSWMDDGVTITHTAEYIELPELGMMLPWYSARPIKDPMYGESYDLAFELGTDADYIKAEQPFNGIRHWPRYLEYPTWFIVNGSPMYDPFTIADDWLCKRRTPVTAAVWWGAYTEYTYEACTGPVIETPEQYDFFMLTIWNNKQGCSLGPFTCPNDVIWEYRAYDYDEVLVGYTESYFGRPYEPVFRYSVRLPKDKWFYQKDVNETYWFSVAAGYTKNEHPRYDWGWVIHEHVSGDAAVFRGNLWRQMGDLWGNTADMSFVLFTDPDECNSCADYNADSIVNFGDYADFSGDWVWTGPHGYNNSDLNCDGSVDFYDLDIFSQQWLSSCP